MVAIWLPSRLYNGIISVVLFSYTFHLMNTVYLFLSNCASALFFNFNFSCNCTKTVSNFCNIEYPFSCCTISLFFRSSSADLSPIFPSVHTPPPLRPFFPFEKSMSFFTTIIDTALFSLYNLIDKTLYQLNFTTLNCDFSDFLPYLYSRQGG